MASRSDAVVGSVLVGSPQPEDADPCVHGLFVGTGYRVGRFRCGPESRRWREVNWIGEQPHVVVPDTTVRLLPAADEAYLSSVNEVILYDRDMHYRRQLVSAEGDRCTFVVIGDALAAELGLDRGRRSRRPRLRHGPLDAGAFARSHGIRAALAADDPDPLLVDDLVLSVLAPAARRVVDRPADGPGTRQQRRAVEEVKAALAADPSRAWRLAELAGRVHYSPFALARMFRRRTGYSIVGYRQQLRLRLSLPEALAATDLSTVAARYGFSSHSHYTSAFRRAFGCPPSQAKHRYVPST
jgi:AraC family transcriptional regulator